jgi:hypothetical protein
MQLAETYLCSPYDVALFKCTKAAQKAILNGILSDHIHKFTSIENEVINYL